MHFLDTVVDKKDTKAIRNSLRNDFLASTELLGAIGTLQSRPPTTEVVGTETKSEEKQKHIRLMHDPRRRGIGGINFLSQVVTVEN